MLPIRPSREDDFPWIWVGTLSSANFCLKIIIPKHNDNDGTMYGWYGVLPRTSLHRFLKRFQTRFKHEHSRKFGTKELIIAVSELILENLNTSVSQRSDLSYGTTWCVLHKNLSIWSPKRKLKQKATLQTTRSIVRSAGWPEKQL